MTTLRRILTTTTLTLAAVGIASADTVITHTGLLTAVQTQSAGPTTFNYGTGGLTPVVALTFNQFNCNTEAAATFGNQVGDHSVSNCRITSLHITEAGSTSFSYNVTNTSGASGKWTVTAAAFLDILSANNAGFTLAEALPSKSLGFNLTASGPGATKSGTLTSSASASADYDCTTDPTACALTGSTGGSVSDPVDVTPYLGNGTFQLFAQGQSAGSIGGNSFTGGISGTGSETVTVQFDFAYDEVITPTPEPVTFALVGSALIGAALVRRRTKKQ